MARKSYAIIVPQWYMERIKLDKPLKLECFWDNGIFAITTPLPNSTLRSKYAITNMLVGMTVYGFDTMRECKECIKRYSEGTVIGADSWIHIETPYQLALQRSWMADIVKDMLSLEQSTGE